MKKSLIIGIVLALLFGIVVLLDLGRTVDSSTVSSSSSDFKGDGAGLRRIYFWLDMIRHSFQK